MKKFLVLGLLSVCCFGGGECNAMDSAVLSKKLVSGAIKVMDQKDGEWRTSSLEELKANGVYGVQLTSLSGDDLKVALAALSTDDAHVSDALDDEILTPQQQIQNALASNRVKNLRIRWCEIDESTFPLLIQAIEKNPSLREFDYIDCLERNLTVKECLDLCDALKKSPVLTRAFTHSRNMPKEAGEALRKLTTKRSFMVWSTKKALDKKRRKLDPDCK